MARELTITSTSDTPEEVARVAALSGDVAEEGKGPKVEQEPKEPGSQSADEVEEKETPEGEAKPADGEESKEDDGEGDKSGEKEEKPHGSRAQKRIGQLTSEKRRLQEELSGTQNRLTSALSALEALNGEGSDGPKPTPSQFPTYEDFLEALDDWKSDQRDKQRASKEAEAAEQAVTDAMNKHYNAALEEAKPRYKDWDEVVGKSDIPVPNAVVDAIKQSTNGPDVLYHLASNPEEARLLSQMTEHQAVMRIGQISDRLAAPPEKKVATSKAPAPVNGVGNGSRGAKTMKSLSDPDLPFQEYKRLRMEGRSQ